MSRASTRTQLSMSVHGLRVPWCKRLSVIILERQDEKEISVCYESSRLVLVAHTSHQTVPTHRFQNSIANVRNPSHQDGLALLRATVPDYAAASAELLSKQERRS